MVDATKKRRKLIIYPKRGPDGLVPEPDKPDWIMLAHNRQRAASHFNYADEHDGDIKTYDAKKGRYRCGDCNQHIEPGEEGNTAPKGCNDCALVDVPGGVNVYCGSCEDWESERADDPETPLKRKSWQIANYGVAKDGEGFGCQDCPFMKAAKNIDPMGRDKWCGEHVCHVTEYGCCTVNGNPTLPADPSKTTHYRGPGAKPPKDYDDDADDDGDDAPMGRLDAKW